MRRVAVVSAVLLVAASVAGAVQIRIRDLAQIAGARDNQLVGYGLVVGLSGGGDTYANMSTIHAIRNVLSKFGVQVTDFDIRPRNVAAVMVTANLPPFAKQGIRLDVGVSAMGDARGLIGGTLVQTPLQGGDGKVYAVAQGELLLPGQPEEAVTGRQPTPQAAVGRIPNGAIVEREVPSTIVRDNTIALNLHQPDFTTASRMALAINKEFPGNVTGTARAQDAATVLVTIPYDYQQNTVEFLSVLQGLTVEPDAEGNKIVISERTGTVVMGADIRIDTVVVTHHQLKIRVENKKQDYSLVAQNKTDIPNTFGYGESQQLNKTEYEVKEGKSHLVVLPESATVMDVVDALNAVGSTPRDLVAVLQAIKAAGALHADIEVI